MDPQPKTQTDRKIDQTAKQNRHIIYAYRLKMVRDKAIQYEQTVTSAQIVAQLVRETIAVCGQSDREQFIVILLNGANKVAAINVVSTGSANSAPVSMRELFKPAILAGAIAIIVAHNHPSGSLKPSAQDLLLTQNIVAAGRLMNIELLDHVIVDSESEDYYSFRDHCLMDSVRRQAGQLLK